MSWLSKFDQNAEIIWKWGTRAVMAAGVGAAIYGITAIHEQMQSYGQKLTRTAEKIDGIEEKLVNKSGHIIDKLRNQEEKAKNGLNNFGQATREKWDGLKERLPHRGPPPAASAPSEAQPN